LQWMGSGEIAKLHLASASTNSDLEVGSIPFMLSSGAKDTPGKKSGENSAAAGPGLEFGPFPVALGLDAPATARGWIDRSGYEISLTGEAEIARALRIARMFGLQALNTTADGIAQVDLRVTGPWAWRTPGSPVIFPPSQLTGRAALRRVRAELRGVDGPIEISAADLFLLPDQVRVGKLKANAAHALWTGSLNWPRACSAAGACLVHFDLNANELDTGRMVQWLSPQREKRPWYQVLTSTAKPGPPFFARLRASGKISAGRLLLHNLSATHVSANVDLEAGKMRISDLRTDFMDGKHRGEWQVNLSAQPPVYRGSGTFTGISLARLADAMKDDWITGTTDGRYELETAGSTAADFWHSAQGILSFTMRDGMLPHISLPDSEGPLQVGRFEGLARLHDGTLELEDSRLISDDGTFRVSGTASFTEKLDLRLEQTQEADSAPAELGGYAITGTVEDPRVAPVSAAEIRASLKSIAPAAPPN
jgi:AsmA-like C-terminal region